MKRLCTLLILSLGILYFPGLFAELSQNLEGADSLTVGTHFMFRIKADYAIKKVTVPDTLQSFALIRSQQGKKSVREWEIILAPLRLGALSFPRLQVLPEKAGFEPDSTDGFRVNVLSVLAEGDSLLRDIKPFRRYFLQPPVWVYLLLFLVAVILIIYLLRRRKKPQPKAVQPTSAVSEPADPAWKIALKELDALICEGWVEKGELALFHFRMSQILRTFLEAEYGFPALEMTTRELSREMQKQQLSQAGELKRWLIYCDLVKFAKAEPLPEDLQYRIGWLRSYLTGFSQSQTGVSDA